MVNQFINLKYVSSHGDLMDSSPFPHEPVLQGRRWSK